VLLGGAALREGSGLPAGDEVRERQRERDLDSCSVDGHAATRLCGKDVVRNYIVRRGEYTTEVGAMPRRFFVMTAQAALSLVMPDLSGHLRTRMTGGTWTPVFAGVNGRHG
jgi:hypothetical protein